MGQVARIPDATSLGRRNKSAPERVLRTPATTARLIPGSCAYAAGAKKSPKSVGAVGAVRATAQQSRSLPKTIESLAPAFLRQLSPQMLGVMLMDTCILCATSLAAQSFLGAMPNTRTTVTYLFFFLAAGMQESLYSKPQNNRTEFLLAKTSVLAALATVLLLLQPTIRATATVALFSVTGFGLMSAVRWVWKRLGQSHASRNVLLIGMPAKMQSVAAAFQVAGSDRRIQWQLPEWQLYEVHGADLLRNLTREKHIDEVVLATQDPKLVALVLAEGRRNSLDVLIAPEIQADGVSGFESIAGVPLLKIREQRVPEWGLALKRIIDVVLATVGLALVLPLMCLIAVGIRLDAQGPILYRALRVGRKGHRFTCYKFRTMVPEADLAKDQLRSRNERQGAFFKMKRDPRITRVGRWLRRYSLDELPQLWNVIRGEMSLVGPRPHPPDDVEGYQCEDLQRLDAIPGMTGLWQVTARNDPSFKHCVALDVEYISHWSLALDFRVLTKTIAAVLHGSGA